MTKREYAEAIVAIIGGEVVEVEKANGIKLTGITRKSEGSNIAPTVYVDEYFRDNATVEFAAERLDALIKANERPDFDTTVFNDFDKAKGRLRARLYNQKTNTDLYKSAEEYGFPDLIIIPYLFINEIEEGVAGAKVTKALAINWNVSEEEIFRIALENSAKETEILSMKEMVLGIMKKDMPDITEDMVEAMLPSDSNPMYVISNTSKCFGAIGAITEKAKLEKMFPNGYVILPSSVHEVIVIPIDENASESELTNMVNEVNSTQVEIEEQLADRAYLFREVA